MAFSDHYPPKRLGVLPISDILDNPTNPPIIRTEEEEDTVDEDAELIYHPSEEELSENEDLNDITDDDIDDDDDDEPPTTIENYQQIIEIENEIFGSEKINLDAYNTSPGYNPRTKSFRCFWNNCNRQEYNFNLFMNHILYSHIDNPSITTTCKWHLCPQNGVPYSSKEVLLSHLRFHTQERPFFCLVPECDFSTSHLKLLTHHIQSEHNYNPFTQSLIEIDESKKVPKEPLSKAKALNPGLLSKIRKIREKESLYNGEDSTDDLPGPQEDESDPNSTINQLKRKLLWSLETQEQLESELNQIKKQKYIEIFQKERLFDQLLHKHLGSTSASYLSLS